MQYKVLLLYHMLNQIWPEAACCKPIATIHQNTENYRTITYQPQFCPCQPFAMIFILDSQFVHYDFSAIKISIIHVFICYISYVLWYIEGEQSPLSGHSSFQYQSPISTSDFLKMIFLKFILFFLHGRHHHGLVVLAKQYREVPRFLSLEIQRLTMVISR